jgi:hypothetical protein
MEKIVFQNPCSLDALKKIALLEKKIFGNNAMPFPKMLNLWKKNPYMFNSLMDESKLLGYVNVLATNEKGAKIMNLKKGIEEKIDADGISEPRRMKSSPLLYFEAIVAVGSGESRKRIAAMLCYGRAEFLRKRFSLPKLVYVVPVTKNGRRLAKSYGAIKFSSVTIKNKSAKHGFYKFKVNEEWCTRAKERASKRAVPTIVFKQMR